MNDDRFTPSRRGFLAAAILITAAAVWWLPTGPPRQVPAFLLLWIWPALSWWPLLPTMDQDHIPGERALTAAALPLLFQGLIALCVHLLPGEVPTGSLLLVGTLLALAPLLRPRYGDVVLLRPRRSQVAALFAVLLLALLLRLPNLGYKELQGDEGIILQRAAAAITGNDQELFLHQKGPVEILLPLSSWHLTGAINEFWARLPFTWAGFLAVAATVALGRRWFSPGAALFGGILFALNGFGVAFSRIIQYQSLVMLWSMLAVLHAVRYERAGKAGDLLLVALFLAGGLLAHYDAILVTPAVGWLLFKRVRADRSVKWRAWGSAILAGGLLLALFYVPFVVSPTFGSTSRYLLEDRLGGELVSWSGPAVWRMITFYNSTYYVVGLILLTGAGLVYIWRRRGPLAPVFLLAAPLLFYVVVVADPRTHVYTIFPGATLLGAAGADTIWQAATTPRRRTVGTAALLLFLLVSAAYVFLLFIDVTPERERTWAENQPTFYPTTWVEPPLYGLFGFPHQAGWRAVPRLVETLPYASNVEEEITDFYLAQAARTHCPNFETFILAEKVQDPVAYEQAAIDSLHLRYRVTVHGRPSLRIYGKEAPATVATVEAAGQTLWRTAEQVVPPQLTGEQAVGATLDDRVRLRGYDLDADAAYPGGQLIITLYWEALAPFTHNYQAFVHLYDGTLQAQHDGAPECAINPTTQWEPGQIIPDPHIVPLPSEIPQGAIPIYTGLYELVNETRLRDATYPDGLIYLGDVVIGDVPSPRE